MPTAWIRGRNCQGPPGAILPQYLLDNTIYVAIFSKVVQFCLLRLDYYAILLIFKNVFLKMAACQCFHTLMPHTAKSRQIPQNGRGHGRSVPCPLHFGIGWAQTHTCIRAILSFQFT